jgi:intracellular multiplication protein IcmL
MAQDAIKTVRMRNKFYQDGYRKLLGILLLLMLVDALLVGVVLFQVHDQPKPRYFATSATGRITPLYALSFPMVNQEQLLQWANEAVVASYSFNFLNYRKNLQQASEYFTPEGWRNFQAALKRSRMLETVLDKKLVVTAVATGAPIVLNRGPLEGHYTWKVQMPILISYQSASDHIQQPEVVTLLISRVSTLNTPKGIAIVQFLASSGPAPGAES